MPHSRARAKTIGEILVLGGWLLILGSWLYVSGAEPPAAPNVILILADDLGWGDLGAYGQTKLRTPRLDRLAAEGLRFTRYYAGAAESTASRCALLTGRHTGHARIRGPGERALKAGDSTLAERMRQAGYRTCAIGKWGLGRDGSSGMPTAKGFDEWFGYLDHDDPKTHYPTDELWRNRTPVRWAGNENGGQAHYAPYLFTDAAINFVRLNRQRPFFLYLAYTLPHAPLQSPALRPFRNQDWPAPQKTLAAMIFRLDREVGRLLDSLEDNGLETRTVVFFTSDNGPHAEAGIDPAFFASTGGLRGHKGSLYEGGIRVPLIVRWPGRIRTGTVSDHLCAAWDFFPTLSELTGKEFQPEGDGISFLPELLGQRQRRHDYLYWESHGPERFARAVRRGKWKGVQQGRNGPLQLFQLDRDPGETTDLAARYRRTARRLQRELDQARADTPDWPLP